MSETPWEVSETPWDRYLSRFAAALLLICGGLLVPTLVVFAPPTADRVALVALGGTASLIAAFIFFTPPSWWAGTMGTVLAVVGLTMVSAASVAIEGWLTWVPYIAGVFYVAGFAWIGIRYERGVPARFSPFVLIVFMAPFIDDVYSGLAPGVFTAAVCAFVGETLSRLVRDLKLSQETEGRQLQAMQALLDSSTALAEDLSAPEVEMLIAERGAWLSGGTAAVLLLVNSTGHLVRGGSWNWPAGSVSPGVGISELLIRRTFDEVWPADVVEQVVHGLPLPSASTVRFHVLHSSTRQVAVLAIADPATMSRRSGVNAFTTSLFSTFGMQAALALERAWATQSLVDETFRDSLTGLGNRRHAEVLLGRARPGDALVMIDLDEFKSVNDRFGHAAGDEVLRDLAEYLHEVLRGRDMVARYGGEEFLIVLRGAGVTCFPVVERLIEGWRMTAPRTTFSAGVAVHHGGATAAETLAEADAALYRAKQSGRDRACIAPIPEEEAEGVAFERSFVASMGLTRVRLSPDVEQDVEQ